MVEPKKEKKERDFSQWYDWILERAEIYDYGRYPIKGMGIWLPYGFQIRKKTIDLIRDLLDSTGHEEILFPLLIPKWMLEKESEHIRGFEEEVFWVTHGGLEELDQKLALRPTSETIITYYESLWYQSYRQLPRKLYQIVSMFRYETKATRPLIRLREVTTFKEAHTIHDTFESAEQQIKEAIDIYKKFFDELGIPYIISKRPDWDKFAGALYTIAFDTMMPDGRTLQIGTVHNLGQSFSKAFNYKIQLKDESFDHPWQTSYGISDRVVATIIGVHGDDNGLVLPPNIAPTQVIVIPIPSSDESETKSIIDYSRKILNELLESKVRAKIDDRSEMTPGEKYYYWEAKGVPVRIEIGSRELRTHNLTVVRRDTLSKITIGEKELINEINHIMNSIQNNLYERAWKDLKQKIYETDNLNEARQYLDKKGIVEIPWCGKESCANKVMESLGAKSLGTPWPSQKISGKKCPICGEKAQTTMRYARQY
ncbi:prolyl-tRNA synthetase, family I [Caldisphaera lagunensis DSM 15908]|uniref:Proline--tRNA ligase n=1 Tax=Caldisphaera lagunensis (strain DSM 15908 / JCM 11604 / ANMR 0165 / IC-154) TaxID=1056495 RepID=L0ADD4_CALLD|nr:proline--tRNA ligase [Caldisphaera lagunensis]AFZ71122.1 prolyl-tRNA synthetase, family I [Caldisphaera lagunensis DSM 15908]